MFHIILFRVIQRESCEKFNYLGVSEKKILVCMFHGILFKVIQRKSLEKSNYLGIRKKKILICMFHMILFRVIQRRSLKITILMKFSMGIFSYFDFSENTSIHVPLDLIQGGSSKFFNKSIQDFSETKILANECNKNVCSTWFYSGWLSKNPKFQCRWSFRQKSNYFNFWKNKICSSHIIQGTMIMVSDLD